MSFGRYILDEHGEPERVNFGPYDFVRRRGMSQSHWRHCDKEFKRRYRVQLIVWGTWFQTADRHLARDEVMIGETPVLVSTVFLGLDHNFGLYTLRREPVLWETMIFGGDLDQFQERYSSREEALEGHRIALARVREQVPQP